MQEIYEIGQDFLHISFEMLPYPPLDMCRKCEEISCFGKKGHAILYTQQKHHTKFGMISDVT